MITDLTSYLRPFLSKGLILDLDDGISAAAFKAHAMVRDYSGLSKKKRQRELEGQARFRMAEEVFETICLQHGATTLDGGIIPLTDLKIFQPFMRFQHEGKGIILGLSAMTEPKIIPQKNSSRAAGVSLNYTLSPRLDLDGTGPKHGDIFVLFLVARDRARAGKIEEIAIGVIDSAYRSFLLYVPLATFLEGSEDLPIPPMPTVPTHASKPKLKDNPKTYTPPESVPNKDKDSGPA